MPHVITDIEIDASPDHVYGVLTDIARYPEWNPVVTRLEVEGPLKVGAGGRVVVDIGVGKPLNLPITYHELNPGAAFSWKGKVLTSHLMGAWHYLHLEALDAGRTRLTHGEVFKGVAIRMVWFKLGPRIDGAYRRMNEAVKARCESMQ